MAESNVKLSSVLWSVGGLLATLLIAWYFSRKNGEPAATAQTSPDQYNFNIGGTTVPTIPPPVTGPTTNPVQSSCCKNCADSNLVSGGKVLQSGVFSRATFDATNAAVQNVSLTTAGTNSTVPIGPTLLPQENGGMPLPSSDWWTHDLLYRQAYVLAYNQTVGQIAQILMQQKRPAISQMPMSYANNASDGAAASLAERDGQTQLARGGHDTRWLIEAQNNSRLMAQTMDRALNQWLQKLGDKNIGGTISMVLPADQDVSKFLIN